MSFVKFVANFLFPASVKNTLRVSPCPPWCNSLLTQNPCYPCYLWLILLSPRSVKKHSPCTSVPSVVQFFINPKSVLSVLFVANSLLSRAASKNTLRVSPCPPWCNSILTKNSCYPCYSWLILFSPTQRQKTLFVFPRVLCGANLY